MNQEAIADAVSARLLPAIREIAEKLLAGVRPAPLLNIHELATEFGLSEPTVRRMVARGMPVEWAASAMRFDLAACHAWRKDNGKRSVTQRSRSRITDEPVPGARLVSRTR